MSVLEIFWFHWYERFEARDPRTRLKICSMTARTVPSGERRPLLMCLWGTKSSVEANFDDPACGALYQMMMFMD